MTDIETRAIPSDPALRKAARENPGGWVYDIDWPYRPELRVPPEAIRGSWRVDPRGELTGEYAVNPTHRPVVMVRRVPAPYMVAAARHLRDDWMVEIDPAAEKLFPNVPEEMRVGFWYVDRSGKLTGQFRPNSKYQGRVGKD